jgi:GT2 family glycosyltransferase
MRYALIPTHNRVTELRKLAVQLRKQLDVLVIIDNASDPPLTVADLFPDPDADPSRLHTVRVVRDEEQPPHLYRMWNDGFRIIKTHADAFGLKEWDVAVFNDDSSVPSGWFDIVASGLRSHPTAVAASTTTHIRINSPWFSTQPGEGGLTHRLCPWAFVVRGEVGMQADETMRWWWGDTDWDWRCRQNGGILLLPGPIAVNTHANAQTNGELAVQAGRDRLRFAEIWGGNPW